MSKMKEFPGLKAINPIQILQLHYIIVNFSICFRKKVIPY